MPQQHEALHGVQRVSGVLFEGVDEVENGR
jgi:hypothetical protein